MPDSIPYEVDPGGGDFILGPGDFMDVRFFGDERMNSTIMIRPDGYISVPLLQEPVLAAGMTLLELEHFLEHRAAEFLVNPDVFLNLVTLGSQQIFVLGEVRNPQIVKTTPATLASAISECGGLTKEARAGQILVIRRWNQDSPQVFEIDFDAFLDGESIFPDMPLQRYDVVVVPRSRIVKVADFITYTFEAGTKIPRFGTEWYYFFNMINDKYSGYRY